jgi:hypothetical protein
MSLTQILQDSAYRLTQFKPARIAALEAGITWKQAEKANTPYVIVLPIPPMAVQLKIRDLILDARQLRARSKGLLEAAKRAVEIAIEQDKAAGMVYLAREGALS